MKLMKFVMNSIIRQISIIFFVSIIFLTLYLFYLKFIGIPRTMALNFYNKAVYESNFDKKNAIKLLEQALHYWQEDYILDKINEIRTNQIY